MKYINLFDTQAAYDAAEKYYPNVSYIEATDEVVYQEISPEPDYSKEYLTFEALANGTFSFYSPAAIDSTKMTSVSYSIDDGANWVTTMIDNTDQTITTPTINAGDKVLWKGVGTALNKSGQNLPIFRSTANCNVSGNIMSMLYGDNFVGQTTISDYGAFGYVFSKYYDNGCKIISAENLVLPATTLTSECYSNMFYRCTSLATAPELPATTLADNCYNTMFRNCTSLTTAPELPATTLADNCYNTMFTGCTSLTTAPELPATTLANGCYQNMFFNCSSLTAAPELPATMLWRYCYQQMFQGCTSLTTAPELPATTLANGCYQNMFYGCTKLNNITMLATNISASNCLTDWVNNVSATGTFTKSAEMTTLPTGANGIPSGWTVVDA